MKVLERKSMPSLVSVIFLFMIVSRLTWLQLRHFPIDPAGFIGPYFGEIWSLKVNGVRSWNINIIIALFFFAPLTIRFLSGSWMIALFAGTVLMSRGAVLARVGWMSLDLSFSMIITVWCCALAHHLRTASPLSLFVTWVALLAGSLLEPSLCVLGLLLPVYRIYLACLRPLPVSSDVIEEGGLFRPLTVPFHEWIRRTKLGSSGLVIDLAAFAIVLATTLAVGSTFGFATQSFETPYDGAHFLDLHFVVSVLILLLCAAYSFQKRDNALTFHALFILGAMLWLCTVGVLHFTQLRPNLIRAVLLWLEPMVICLSCAGGVFIFQELRRLSWRRQWRHSHVRH